ncbi:MAG: SDR family oxidoreductase [Candidatus Bathyarchaeia archaeon]
MSINTILVTGGAGFIGSHLVRKLLELGFKVRVLDNLSTGKKNNLAGILGQLDFIKGDVRNIHVLEEAVQGVDAIFHLAALTDVHESLEKPTLYHEVNCTGTLNMLEAAKGKVKKLVYASTAAVYGNPQKLPISETDTLNPISPYAASKLSAENYCMAYLRSYGLKVTVLRLFNVYGPGQSGEGYSGVIAKFIHRIKRGQPPIIFGDGTQTRDFIFIDDVVSFILRALERDVAGVYNVGTGESTSIRYLAELILELMNRRDLGVVFSDSRPEDVLHSIADMSKSLSILGYASNICLQEGLSRLLENNKI